MDWPGWPRGIGRRMASWPSIRLQKALFKGRGAARAVPLSGRVDDGHIAWPSSPFMSGGHTLAAFWASRPSGPVIVDEAGIRLPPLLRSPPMAARNRWPYLGHLRSLRGPCMARFARNRSGYPYPLLQFSAGRRRTMRGSLGSWSPGNGRSSRRLWPMGSDAMLES